MKPQLLTLLIFAGCQSGGGNSDVTQNILHCENYGAIDQSTTTEVTYEPEIGTGEASPESELQPIGTTEPTPENTSGAGLKPVAPGLNIGLEKSAVSEAEALECEQNGLCAIVGVERQKVIVEYCSNISFPEVAK